MSNLPDTMGVQMRSWEKIPAEPLLKLKEAYRTIFEVFMNNVGPVDMNEFQEFAAAKPYWVLSFFADGQRKPEFKNEGSWFDFSPREFD